MKISLLLVAAAAIFGVASAQKYKTVHTVKVGKHDYKYLTSGKGAGLTHDEGASLCKSLGMNMAEINHANVLTLANQKPVTRDTPVWVKSWQGNNYDGTRLVLHRGGAIVKPRHSKKLKTIVLCESK